MYKGTSNGRVREPLRRSDRIWLFYLFTFDLYHYIMNRACTHKHTYIYVYIIHVFLALNFLL